ncbi:sodium channel protein Nach-like isoform X1 [Phymastichus coffea]|uniref:sodium channel protein Nach-like isoform X1 n=1 Tax=Phymastichus coffea TaxID=108790 RepID=UPI00273BF234|nr:sodium channel protein Nach-like isoform X1 [Phymastichus coffea]
MISPPNMHPSKARKIRLRRKYNVNIQFMCVTASSEVIQQENSKDKFVCKYENNTYNYKACLDSCEKTQLINMCECNPTFLYPINASHRECKIEDLTCLTKKTDKQVNSCVCLKDCKYCYYDDEPTRLDFDENVISIDVHYDSPTGMLYRKELVASDLDLLVQFGGIFGLFLGGSLITVIEFIYYCFVGTIVSIFQIFIKLKNKNKMAFNNTT